MRKAIKNKGKIVKACELGLDSPMERQLMADGKLKRHPDGTYEIFSLEAQDHGERAATGDYIKVSADGTPYPNTRAFFLANHRSVEGDIYEQIPKPLCIWTMDDPMCPEIEFLISVKELTIGADGFSAPLWGTIERAARDAVIVFYAITYAADGSISDADFNFVAKAEFDSTYSVI